MIGMGLVAIPIMIFTLLSTPIYETEATIIFEEPNDTMFALDFGQPFYNKSAQVNLAEQIMSRGLSEAVAEAMPSDLVQKFEIPEDLPRFLTPQKIIARTIRNAINVLQVRGSDIVKIRLQFSDPEAARDIANIYVDKIIEWNLDKNRQAIISMRDFIESQIPYVSERMNISEQALRTYKENNKLVSLSTASQEILTRMTDFEVAYNEIKTEREVVESKIKYINMKRKQLLPNISVSSTQRAQQLRNQLIKLEERNISTNVFESDSVNAQISQLKNELIDELLGTTQLDSPGELRNLLQESITLDVELETYKAREHSLKKIIDNYNAELQILPKQELDLARLVRDKEVNDKIYLMLLEKREEARITEAGKVSDIRVIDRAETPLAPIKPNKKKNFLLALVLGFSFGVALAFFLNSLDNSIKSQEDLEKITNLPVLASIPNMSQNGVLQKVRRKNFSTDSPTQKLLSHTMTKSHIYEAYQSFKLNLAFVNPDDPLKSLLITSSIAGEGKTLTSVNIAQLFSRSGIKVLLVDCDLRRPMVHNVLQISQEPGLTNLLVDMKRSLSSSVQNCDNENLWILTSGTLPPNPSEILNSQKMKDTIAEAKENYDLLILDAPPIIAVTDSIVLGTHTDGVCLVVRSGKTSREAVIKAIKIMENSSIKTVGMILNDVNLKSIYGYYHDYYYYSKKEKKT